MLTLFCEFTTKKFLVEFGIITFWHHQTPEIQRIILHDDRK